MSETAQKILESIEAGNQYNFSRDSVIRDIELKAVDELVSMGYIVVKARTIGYVVAEVL